MAALVGLALFGCDSAQVAAPTNIGVQWLRITDPATAYLSKYPDWRGNRIAFAYLNKSNNHVNIALVDPDGKNLTYLSEGASENQLEPRWVDDSTLIYTLKESPSSATSFDLWMRTLSTDQIRQLTTFPGDELSPAPRPGTSGVAYTEQGAKGRIVLIPDYFTATPDRYYLTPPTLDCGEADWDPAGQRVCFTADSTSAYRHVWMVTLAPGDSTPVQITTGPYFDSAPRFSPDGSQILFVSPKRTGRPGVWSVEPTSGHLRLIAFDDAGSTPATPAWSPDMSKVVVVSTARGGQALWVVSNFP